MKKIMFFVATLLTLTACENNFVEDNFIEDDLVVASEVDAERDILEECCRHTYILHTGLVRDGFCNEEEPCCWEYVRKELREKFEAGELMTKDELNAMVHDMLSYPVFWDTLGEDECFDYVVW